MKSQSVYPPKTSVTISDDFLQNLTRRLGECNKELFPWIGISLIHPTYLNENKNEIQGIERRILDTLASLAASFLELMLFDVAHQDDTLSGMADYAQFTQAVKQNIMQLIFDDFNLGSESLIGKGEKDKLPPSIKFTLARQFFGSLLLCYGYDLLKPVIYKLTQRIISDKKVLDYKTILQEYSQAKKLGAPRYDVIEEQGPNHQKEFIIQVSTIDGKSAQAKGSSKHDASKKAALEYINHFVPTLLTNKPSQLPKNLFNTAVVPVSPHKDFVLLICKEFNADQGKAWIFSQSLTHPSFVNEVKNRKLIDNKKHAQLGAKVLEAFFTQQISLFILENLSSNEINIEQYRSILSSETFSDEGFKLLNLQNAILLGAGEKNIFYRNITSKAEVFQAVIGAAFKSHGTWNNFFKNIPKALEELFLAKLQIVSQIDSLSEFDPISGLNVFLQAISLNWNYKFIISGPDHQKQYKPQINLQSELTGENFTIKSGTAYPSKKSATRHVASIALKAINIINSELGVDTKKPYEDNVELVQFSKFLLTHILTIHLGRADILRWHKLGILGSQLLAQGKVNEFKLWAIAIGNIIQSKNIANALSLYSSTPIVSEQEQVEYKSDITSIGRFIENLSPEINTPDIRLSHDFDRTLKLSKIYKLLSQNWGTVKLQEIMDGFILLRRGRSPEIIIGSNIPDIVISEKEGTYQTMFLDILDLVEQSNPDSKETRLTISFSFNTQKSELIIIFSLEQPISSSEEIGKRLNEDMLWKYLHREANIINAQIDTSTISIATRIFSPDNSFASQALDAYKMTSLLSKSENQTTSQLLHDLKNQLIAYQVSLDTAGKDRTSVLRARFEASQHLDNAAAIYHSLEAVSNSMTTPTIEPIDIEKFIRSYIADKLTILPLNIRLEMPKTMGSSIVYTSKSFLNSMFENLIKNAIEAMPNGGEIRIDWIYDNSVDLLMVDISDTGSGLTPETVNKIKLGKVIDSSKHKGSGIGILSVQSMAERLGGSWSVSSELGKGTQWNITLPSISPKDTVESNDKDELLENFITDEMEIE